MDMFAAYFRYFGEYFVKVCSVSFTVFGFQVYYGSFLLFSGILFVLVKFLRGLSE